MVALKRKVSLKEKGEQAVVSVQRLQVSLKWTAEVDLDLMAFYKTKSGRLGGVYSAHYKGGTLGSLDAFPFIKLSGDAGVGATQGEKEETMQIAQLDEIEEVFICAINFTDAIAKRPSSFNKYDAGVDVIDDKNESVHVPLNSSEQGTVAVIAKLVRDGAEAKMINENRIMDLATFQKEIPGAAELEVMSKITLATKGSTARLRGSKFHATLKWSKPVDLDLHCFYKKKSGGFFSKLFGAETGHVYFADRGSRGSSPYIFLDEDAGVGDKGGENEENIYFTRLDAIEHALIACNIFNKPNSNFAGYDGIVEVKIGEQEIVVPLMEDSLGSWCIIAHVDNSGREANVININKVQRSEPSISQFT